MHRYKLVRDAQGHHGIQCSEEIQTPVSWNKNDVEKKYCALHHMYFTHNVETTPYDSPMLKLSRKIEHWLHPQKAYVLAPDDDCAHCEKQLKMSAHTRTELVTKKVKNKLTTISNSKERATAWIQSLK